MVQILQSQTPICRHRGMLWLTSRETGAYARSSTIATRSSHIISRNRRYIRVKFHAEPLRAEVSYVWTMEQLPDDRQHKLTHNSQGVKVVIKLNLIHCSQEPSYYAREPFDNSTNPHIVTRKWKKMKFHRAFKSRGVICMKKSTHNPQGIKDDEKSCRPFKTKISHV